jgi:hypothetical protein
MADALLRGMNAQTTAANLTTDTYLAFRQSRGGDARFVEYKGPLAWFEGTRGEGRHMVPVSILQKLLDAGHVVDCSADYL